MQVRLLGPVQPRDRDGPVPRFAGLVRAYARERALAEERAADRRAALDRALAARLGPAGVDRGPGPAREPAGASPPVGAAWTAVAPASRSLAMSRSADRSWPARWAAAAEDRA
ncbi:hypothetical protein GCM10009780_69320 [Actinomadura alba]